METRKFGKQGILTERVIVFMLVVLLCSGFGSEQCPAGQSAKILKLHLPRETVIDDKTVSLTAICHVSGYNEFVEKADGTLLGRLSVPGQEMVIDRATIISRLATAGIEKRRISFTGAEMITVRRKEGDISGEAFVEAAEEYLENSKPAGLDCKWTLRRMPEGLIVAQAGDAVKLVTEAGAYNNSSQAHVRVVVMRGGQEVDWRDVIFKLEYPCRQAVAANDIVKGQTISPENVRIETVYQSRPEKGWRGPYGLVARRDISAGSVISDIMVASPKPEVVIKRRQTVMVRYENGPLSLTAMGQAMEEGTAGSFIKVRMQITNHARIIYARVLDDGTVEPVI